MKYLQRSQDIYQQIKSECSQPKARNCFSDEATRFHLSGRFHDICQQQESTSPPKQRRSKKEMEVTTCSIDRLMHDILWEKLPSLNFGRWSHVAFKIDDVIYVAGGFDAYRKCLSSCDEYSLVDKIWRKSDYELPYPLANAVVEVDSQQKFAIIAGGIVGLTEESAIGNNYGKFDTVQDTSKIISFSKEHGFREVEKCRLQKMFWGQCSNAIAIRY